jgi:hypothetical protein
MNRSIRGLPPLGRAPIELAQKHSIEIGRHPVTIERQKAM